MAVIPERDAWAGLGIGLAVGAFGLWEAGRRAGFADNLGIAVTIALAMAFAAGTYRLLPSLALALVWAASVLQVAAGRDVAVVQLAIMLVAYGAARHGSVATVWCSGLSIPVGAAIALLYVRAYGTAAIPELGRAIAPNGMSLTTAFLLVLLVLSAPWALGLVLRLSAQFGQARAAREQAEIDAARAEEIAELRAEQARLARDVHDVVGHSLAVILAQADSAEVMEDGDIDRIRAALANISTSARRSLGDVRQVLSSTNDPADMTARPIGGLDSLVEGVRAAGNQVDSVVRGTPRQLPAEVDVVAYRVLQEMLTNALKHGRRGAPIAVERSWDTAELRIEVRNAMADDTIADSVDGQGQAGMRRRLEGVGGRLEVGHRDSTGDGRIFLATARLPNASEVGQA